MKIVAEELRKKLCEEDINPMKLDSVSMDGSNFVCRNYIRL